MRRVVLVCGPPGSGKSTFARSLGVKVFDIDDAQWCGSEREFVAALRRLGATADAEAVVIRSGATRSARAAAAGLVGATEVRVLATDPETCVRRVVARNRLRPPVRAQIAAVRLWFESYEPDEVPARTSREW